MACSMSIAYGVYLPKEVSINFLHFVDRVTQRRVGGCAAKRTLPPAP